MDRPLRSCPMNAAALGAWAILIAAPRRWALLGLVPRLAVPALVSVVYAALIAAHRTAAEGGFGAPAAVRRLFAPDPRLVAGWGHYLAFDLIVGALLADRMDRTGIGRLLQAPVLLATFLVGPVGWLPGTGALAAAGALPDLRPAAARGGEGCAMAPIALDAPAAAGPVHAARSDPAAILRAPAGAALAMLAAFLAARAVDPRLLDGVNVWTKPAKFALSLGVFFLTLAPIVARLSPRARRGRALALCMAAMAVSFWGEMAYITLAAGRGEASHFNTGTPWRAAAYALMALGATALVLGVAAIGLIAARDPDARLGPGLRAGILWGLPGSAVLTLVTAFTLGAGEGHFVGTPAPGAPTLPVFGWSAEVGDLRPAHLFALHMMQALPLLGLLADRQGWPPRPVAAAGALAWTALTLAVFVQALLGLPLVRL